MAEVPHFLIPETPEQRETLLERIRELRAERGIGLLEAKRIAEREAALIAIANARTVEDLKQILIKMIAQGKLM